MLRTIFLFRRYILLKIKNMEKNRLVKALFSKYKAEMDDAIARLEIYAKNPVAIGEHPQHTEEMDKLVQQYCDAKDKMESLKEMIKELS